jgi:hypothetical protein
LIVGVGDYQDVNVIDLPGIDLDVAMMQAAAERLGFENVKTLFDGEATYDHLKHHFEHWLINGTRAGDRVLFYFSGHGGCVADQNDDEADGKDEALVLYDTALSMENALSDDEFRVLLQSLSGRRVLVLIDACHSGTGHKGFDLRENRSLGVRRVRVGREKWHVYTKSFNCEARSWSSGNRSFEVVDAREPIDGIGFLAAAADHELSVATSAGSLFTLGLNKAIKDAVADRQSYLDLPAIRKSADSFIRSSIASGDVRGQPHQPQFWGDPAFPIPRTALPDGGGPIWRQLTGLADRAHRITSLRLAANRNRYQVGDELVLDIDIPHAGYLNVVNVGSQDNPTVLFPNRYHRDNDMQEGTLTLPTPEMPFRLRATEPTGRSLIVAFLTKQRMDLYEEGVGGRNQNGEFVVLFADLSARALDLTARTIGVTPSPGWRGVAGGKVVIEVVR